MDTAPLQAGGATAATAAGTAAPGDGPPVSSESKHVGGLLNDGSAAPSILPTGTANSVGVATSIGAPSLSGSSRGASAAGQAAGAVGAAVAEVNSSLAAHRDRVPHPIMRVASRLQAFGPAEAVTSPHAGAGTRPPLAVVKQVIHGETTRLLITLRENLVLSSGDDKSVFAALTRVEQHVNTCPDDGALNVADIVAPFADVVRSPVASGPFTASALASLINFLQFGVVISCRKGFKSALANIAEAVTNCRFEATDAARDEVVLMMLLQCTELLLSLPDVSTAVSDDAVWDLFHNAYRMCTEHRHSLMLRELALVKLKSCVAVLFRDTLAAVTANGSTDTPAVTSHPDSHGLASLVKVFSSLCTWLRRAADALQEAPAQDAMSTGVTPDTHDTALMILQLLHAALVAAGPMVAYVPVLIELIKDDLWFCLLVVSERNPSAAAFSVALRVFQCLFVTCSSHLRMQMEVACHRVFLRPLKVLLDLVDRGDAAAAAASGTATTPSPASSAAADASGKGPHLDEATEHRVQLAIAMLDQFFCDNTLPFALFIRYDCQPDRSDVITDMVFRLSKLVTLMQGPLVDPTLFYLLDSILSLTRTLSTATEATRGDAEDTDNADTVVPTSPAVQRLEERRRVKQLLRRAVSLFAEKPKRCFAFLQQVGLMSAEPTPVEVATFLRNTPGLNRTAIGQFLGSGEDNALRKAYFDLFVFKGQPLLSCLRMVLQTFWLPGESQQIDRLMQAFAEACLRDILEAAMFATSDCLYILSFSIIMLNTSLHNPSVSAKSKMSLSSFLRQNKYYGDDTNHGVSLGEDFLTNIYNDIAQHRISPPLESLDDSGQLTDDMWRDLIQQAAIVDARDRASGSETKGEPSDVPTPVEVSFLLLEETWKPLLHALEHTFSRCSSAVSTEAVIQGIMHAAQLAVAHRIKGGLDSILIFLCRQSGLLRSPDAAALPTVSYAGAPPLLAEVVKYGRDVRAQIATVALFEVLRRHGDHARSAWRFVFHLILRLHRLGLLPSSLQRESEDDLLHPDQRVQYDAHVQALQASHRTPRRAQPTGLLGWLWGTPEAAPEPATEETEDSRWPGLSINAVVQLMETNSAATVGTAAGAGAGVTESGASGTDLSRLESPAVSTPAKSRSRTAAGAGTPITMASLPAWAHDKALRAAIECVIACRLDQLIADSRYLSVPALQELIRSLRVLSMGPAAAPEDMPVVVGATTETAPAPEPAAHEITAPPAPPAVSSSMSTFALQLMTEIALRNRDRMDCVWELVQSTLANVISNATAPSHRVDKAVCGLIRLVLRLLPRESLPFEPLSSLRILEKLSDGVAEHLKPHIASGVARMLTASAANITSAAGWSTVFALLQSCADHPTASKQAFEALMFVLRDPHLRACVPLSASTPLNTFLTSTAGGDQRSMLAIDLLFTLHERLMVLVPESRIDEATVTAADANDVDQHHVKMHVWLGGWLPVISSIRAGCEDPRPSVRLHSLEVLQLCLLDNRLAATSAQHLQRIFETIVFSLAKSVLAWCRNRDAAAPARPASTRTPLEGHGGMTQDERICCTVVAMLGKVFLHCLPSLAVAPSYFHQVYVQVLRLCEQFGTTAPYSVVRDAAREAVRNVVSVLNAAGMFAANDNTAGRELWELTSVVLDPFCPEICASINSTASATPTSVPATGTPAATGEPAPSDKHEAALAAPAAPPSGTPAVADSAAGPVMQ